jgi:hypothetical protein
VKTDHGGHYDRRAAARQKGVTFGANPILDAAWTPRANPADSQDY